MIKIKKLSVGQLKTNCYVVYNSKTSEGVIIDPGDDAEYIIRTISEEKVNPKVILATHGHFDHIMASYVLKHTFNIPFLMNKKDLFLLDRMQSSAKHFLGIRADPPPKVDNYLTRNTAISFGNINFKVIQTPGHTPGSVSFYSEKDKVVFVGDLIFAGGICGRTDLSYSDSNILKASVKKILRLPKNTKILTGHGKTTFVSKLFRICS